MKVHKNNTKNIVNEMKLLKSIKNLKNVPKLVESSNIKNKKVIIEALMGSSIEKLHWFCNNRFTELTVALIGLNIMKILKDIHNIGVIHRDIKPSNICFGSFYENNKKFIKTINLVDFGLGKRFILKNFHKTSMKEINHFDKTESLFYVLIYLRNGTLAWVKNKVKNKVDYLMKIIKIY